MLSDETLIGIWETATGRALTPEQKRLFRARPEVKELRWIKKAAVIDGAHRAASGDVLRLAHWIERARAAPTEGSAVARAKKSKRKRNAKKKTQQSKTSKASGEGRKRDRDASGGISGQSNKTASGFVGGGPKPPADIEIHRRIGRANPEEYQ